MRRRIVSVSVAHIRGHVEDGHMPLRLIRLPQVRERTGLGVTSIYGRIRDGVFPPPVRLTARCSAWPSHEIDAVVAAIIAGRSKDEIRHLVRGLTEQRTAPHTASAGGAQ